MANKAYTKHLGRAAFTISLDGLVAGAARQSAAVDVAALKVRDLEFDLLGVLAASGVSATGTIDIYAGASWDGTNFTDGATGTDAAFTVANRKNMKQIDSIVANENSQIIRSAGVSIAKAFDFNIPPKVIIVVINNTAANFPTNPTPDWSAGYSGIYDESDIA